MDPLAALIIAWLLARGLVEDTIYAARGRPSPRQEHRLRHGPTGAAKVASAVGSRMADRISQPRQPGPVRRYMSGLWADAWDSAAENRRERGARKRARTQGSAPPPRGRRWWQWNRPRPDPEPVPEPEPVRAQAEILTTTVTPKPDHGSPEPDHGPEVIDAEIVTDEEEVPTKEPVPETPTSTTSENTEHTQEEHMSAPTSTNVSSVTAAEGGLGAYLAWAEAMKAACDEMVTSCEGTAANLAAQQYGEGITGLLAQAQELAASQAQLMTEVHEKLSSFLSVSDAYSANVDAGSKESLLAL